MSAPALAEVQNNPGHDRPGLGFTPAVLQAGDFTLEQGLPGWSRADGVSQYSADTLLRLGVGHALELQLGTGWNRLKESGSTTTGRYDTSLAVKFAPKTTGDVSWGLLGSVEFTDGAQAFRAERTQYLLGASVSWQRSENHALGLYLEAAHGDSDNQMLAVNSSHALTETLNMYVEAAAQHLGGIGHGSMGGAGLAWQVTPRVQLDIGVRHRLGGHADTWQGGAGFSVYFGD
ncbi:MAG: transporter [Desulfobulbus sp.]|nr:transporter [Desulfobulbus sp.]